MRLPLAGAALLLVSAAAMQVDDRFAFQPVRASFQPTILDAGRFVEAPTGKHGFLTVKGDRFVFQDGTPARFWGAQVNAVAKDQVDYMVRRMRRQGINVTRLHGLEFLNDRAGKTSFDYSPAGFDRLDYLIAKLGENGIYLILDTDYPLTYRFKPGDQIPGLPEGGPAPYAEFFDERVQWVLQNRMIDILTHTNPYTKKRYCDDPTLALVEIHNEDSLFWGQIPSRYTEQLETKFRAWLRNPDAKWLPNRSLLFDRMTGTARDQLRFMLELEDQYWDRMREAARKAGVRVPIAATNWQGHGSPTTRVHMLGQSKLDYIDRHGYWDHPQGEGNLKWSIATAQFHNLPMVKAVKPDQDHLVWLGVGNLVTEKAWEQVLGRPLTVSEWNTCLPNEHSLEGTGLMAAYGLMQGWDGSLQFGYFSPDFRNALGNGSFDLFGNPPQILQFPAAAAMWHRGDVREAEVVAESLYDNDTVFEPTEDRKTVAASLVGKVGYRFVDKQRRPVARDLSKYWNPATLTARSITGELTWDAAEGVVSIDTPRTQAVIGFLSARRHTLAAVRIDSPSRFGAVWVTAMDGQEPIAKARSLLITAVGPARNTGMQYRKTDAASRLGNLWKLDTPGQAPALLDAITGQIAIRTTRHRQMQAWTLDAVGQRITRLPLDVNDTGIVLHLKADARAVYWELTAN